MFPFWEVAIAPVLEAARARRIVEIGAFRGENTEQLLDRLGPDTVLHVIDPVPDFDPAEHGERFAGQYVFHQDLSVNVLPGLEPMDAALIDGDHNWFTVYHELSMLRQVARDRRAPLPIMLLHDVLWPYGRRDLYYDPETVPAEFRQPYRQAGMRMDRKKLLTRGGLNPTMFNAEVEGGPRNGVMTAIDDWMAEHDRPLRLLVLPIYFGLAIVVEEERLQQQPEVAAALERLESREGKHDLLLLGEDLRLRAMVMQHNMHYPKLATIERLTARYLDIIKAALLNEHYLETETRLDQLETSLDAIRAVKLPGDLVECGTGRSGGAIFLKAYITAHEMPARTVWVADPFDGSTSAVDQAEATAGLGTDLDTVRDGFARFDLLDDEVRFLQGGLDATLAEAPIEAIALLRVGPGLGPTVTTVLDRLYDRITPDGVVVIEGADPAAVEAFRRDRRIVAPLEQVDSVTVTWRRQAADGTGTEQPAVAPLATARRSR